MKKTNRFGKRFSALLASVCLAAGFLTLPSSQTLALYNDAVYDSYKNMNRSENASGAARYVVPNLYRQDASYTNVKSFPLVVSGGVSYVPLDIFALYSYLEVVYGRISYSFYINNTKNGRYIAFDIDNGTTTTDSGETLDIESKLFYRTYYVPAKDVCGALGLNFEFYDNADDGICAARISDSKAKYTLAELVKMYSPTKKPSTEDTSSDDNKTPSQDPDPKPDNPVISDPTILPPDKTDDNKPDPQPPKKEETPPEDPYKNVAARTLYLTFDNIGGSTDGILSVLRTSGIKATFFMTAEQIYAYPDTVRRVVADGHTPGLLISPTDGQNVLTSEEILARITEAQEALKLVTKAKTRLLRLIDRTKALEENGFFEETAAHGYRIYRYTLDSGDGAGRAQSVFQALCTTLAENKPKAAQTYHVRFGSHAVTAEVLTKLINFFANYTQFNIRSFDETTLLP